MVFSRLRLIRLSWTLAIARLAVRFGVDRVRGARAFEERLCARVRAYPPINAAPRVGVLPGRVVPDAVPVVRDERPEMVVGTTEVGTDARRPCPVP